MHRSARTERLLPLKRSRSKRILLATVMTLPVLIIGLWVAIHRVTWLGPMVADALRAVIGKEAVTELENVAYGLQDQVFQYYRKGEQPKAYWDVPRAAAAAGTELVADGGVASERLDAATAPSPALQPKLPAFAPPEPGPVHSSWSAPGDGQWVPVIVRDLPHLEPTMLKTLLHPDKNRSWAELFVVAIDMRRVDIHLVAGTREPKATEQDALELERPGLIPQVHHASVIAAFNGGFKTEHGKYGMRVNDITLVAPREQVCTVALFKNERVQIATWEALAPRGSDMLWWRQTPNCMYEAGKMHPRLAAGYAKKWGATLDGQTVIRRSAIGVDATGDVLFVGISNHTTANAIAYGMHHAGAVSVAQLDVNFSYPKYVLFEADKADGPRQAVALAQGFEFSPDEYLRKRQLRDFFYLLPKQRSGAQPSQSP